MFKKILVLIILSILVTSVIGAVAGRAEATTEHPWCTNHTFANHSEQLTCAQKHVKHTNVDTTVWVNHRWFVKLNNGATFQLVPCAQHDSWNCFWMSTRRYVGGSFANVRGRIIATDKSTNSVYSPDPRR